MTEPTPPSPEVPEPVRQDTVPARLQRTWLAALCLLAAAITVAVATGNLSTLSVFWLAFAAAQLARNARDYALENSLAPLYSRFSRAICGAAVALTIVAFVSTL